jgi:uncharacterized protein YggL (DUF469 family)
MNIEEAIEANGLIFGGGGGSEKWEGFVCHDKIYQSPTEEDREIIKSWLKARPEVKDATVGELIDAWYA